MSWLDPFLAFSKKQHFTVVQKLSSEEVEDWTKSSVIALSNTHWFLPFFLVLLVAGTEEHVKAGAVFSDLIYNETRFCLDSWAELCETGVENLFADVLTHGDFTVIDCPHHCSRSQVPILTHHWQVLWAGNVFRQHELKLFCLNRIRTLRKSIFVQRYSQTNAMSFSKCNHHSSRDSNILTIVRLRISITTYWSFRINLFSVLKSNISFTQSLLSWFFFPFITNELHFILDVVDYDLLSDSSKVLCNIEHFSLFKFVSTLKVTFAVICLRGSAYWVCALTSKYLGRLWLLGCFWFGLGRFNACNLF